MYYDYEARITYRDALGAESVEYVAHDAQDVFYAMFTGAVCGITLSHGVVTKAEILRTPLSSVATKESEVI